MEFGRIIKKFKIGERRKCAQNSMNITILPKVQAENQRRFFARLGTVQTLFKTDCNFFVKSVDKFLISEYYAFTISETCGEA